MPEFLVSTHAFIYILKLYIYTGLGHFAANIDNLK